MPAYNLACAKCSKPFTASRGLHQPPPKFCSTACFGASNTGKAWGWGRETGHPAWNKGKRGYANVAARKFPYDFNLLRSMYVDQKMSTADIAEYFGVTRPSVGKVLRSMDIPIRDFRAAALLVQSKRSPEEKSRNAEASHAAIRGKKRSGADLRRRAVGKQLRAKLSKCEAMLRDELQKHGIETVPQYAVDKFNIDFAIPRRMLAIEVDGGNWHESPKKRRGDEAKCEILEAHGWTILRLKANRKNWVEKSIQKITALL